MPIETEIMDNAGKFRQIEACAQACGCTAAIEVGTYHGDMTARLATVFKKVVTIELDPELARKATETLKGFGNVEVMQGDGVSLLVVAIRKLVDHRPVIYLDGHYSGEGTACGDEPEPAVLELMILLMAVGLIGAIVIDDLRCMGTEPGFPKKSLLLESAEQFEPYGFRVLVKNDQVLILKEAP